MPMSAGHFSSERKYKHTILRSPSWYCTIYN